ncbi:hypothetical protein JTB14_007925 [Gonioctena quinquepunctata]|nr:hypothetical protein JTB14_007925 [Gonioctena quinquepunctata]
MDCGSRFEIVSTKLGDCDDSGPCQIYAGRKVDITVEMEDIDQTPPENAFRTRAILNVMGMNWNVPISPEDPCKESKCPKYKNGRLTYKGTVDLSHFRVMRPGFLRVMSKPSQAPGMNFCLDIPVDII